MDPIRVVLAPDHPIVGVGMHILEETRYLFEDLAPDILLIEMTLDNGLEPRAPQPAESAPAPPRVLVLRSSQNRAIVFGLLTHESGPELTEHYALQLIAEAVQAGLAGATAGRRHRIVARPPPRQLESTPTEIPDLTAREAEVLRQLITGKTNQGISHDLGISEWTVRYHLKNIFRKLGVKRRSEAIAWVMRTRWTTPN